MRVRLFRAYLLRFALSYPRRAAELLLWWRHRGVWRAGYGSRGPGLRGVALEACVRVAELLGLGLAVQLVELGWAGGRYRLLENRERVFLRTYFTGPELRHAAVDLGSTLLARPLRVAFVLGFACKAHGRISPTLLAHELVHVRQFRRWGWAYVAKAVHAQAAGAGYRYPAAFRATRCERVLAEARPEFAGSLRCVRQVTGYDPRLNAEQEAARLEDHARERLGLAPRWVA